MENIESLLDDFKRAWADVQLCHPKDTLKYIEIANNIEKNILELFNKK